MPGAWRDVTAPSPGGARLTLVVSPCEWATDQFCSSDPRQGCVFRCVETQLFESALDQPAKNLTVQVRLTSFAELRLVSSRGRKRK